jgi:hypothetical protein
VKKWVRRRCTAAFLCKNQGLSTRQRVPGFKTTLVGHEIYNACKSGIFIRTIWNCAPEISSKFIFLFVTVHLFSHEKIKAQNNARFAVMHATNFVRSLIVFDIVKATLVGHKKSCRAAYNFNRARIFFMSAAMLFLISSTVCFSDCDKTSKK